MIYHEEWDHLVTPSRREQRKERKQAKRADRSKYKHTDQAKQTHVERLAKHTEGLEQGKVIGIQSHEISVATGQKIFTCSLRGVCKFDRTLQKNLVVVGDNVLFEVTAPNTGYIHLILPRSSLLCRAEHFHRVKQQLVAANVDCVLITVSVAEPLLKPSIIDRYVLAAQKGNLSPVLVINKIDFKESYPREAMLADECLRLYSSLGIPTIALSAVTGEGLEELKRMLKDKVSVFSGQSGTGKTCILNALTGLSLRTGSIRAVGKGSHTTTSPQMIPLPFGGWCIDTPGIRSFGVFDLRKEDLPHAFPEIFSQPCAFANCWHRGEQGCAVPEAIAQGRVSPLRLTSYITLLGSLDPSARD